MAWMVNRLLLVAYCQPIPRLLESNLGFRKNCLLFVNVFLLSGEQPQFTHRSSNLVGFRRGNTSKESTIREGVVALENANLA